MARFIVFSDLHLRLKDGEVQGLKVLREVFNYALNEDAHILFAGDLFDDEKAVPHLVLLETVEEFVNFFYKAPRLKFIAISGNHDMATRSYAGVDGNSILNLFEAMFENFILLSDSSITIEGKEITGFNYVKDKDNFNLFHSEIYKGTDIFLTHQTFDVLESSKFGYEASLKDFEQYAENKPVLVINGHIHKSKDIDQTKNLRFLNAGSCFHLDASDVDSVKYIYLLEFNSTGKQLISYINTCYLYPRYISGEEMRISDLDILLSEPETDMNTDKSGLDYSFSSTLPAKDIVINYWKQTNGEDKDLLDTGLNLISYE